MHQTPKVNHERQSEELTSLGFIGHVRHPLDLLALMRLLLKSFLNSEETRLTGAFFYDGAYVGEILEGPTKAVESRWQMIHSDTTFNQLQILGKRTISLRNFSRWSMHAKDGELVRMFYPELTTIIGEFNLKNSVFETILLACEADSSRLAEFFKLVVA